MYFHVFFTPLSPSTPASPEGELDEFDDEEETSGDGREQKKKQPAKQKMEELAFFQLEQQDIYQVAFGHFEDVSGVAFYTLSLLKGR